MEEFSNCTLGVDYAFGPVVQNDCRGGFDFTLLFERSILTLLPAAVFLLTFLVRFAQLLRADIKTSENPLRVAKLWTALLFVALQVALLVLYTRDRSTSSSVSIAAATVNLIVALHLIGLSWIEDSRSVKPSTLLISYLLFTIFLDIPQARSLWLLRANATLEALAGVFSASIAAKIALLLLETRQKRIYLKTEYQDLPPESTSGIINRSFLWWINDLFRRGFHALISINDLYQLDTKLTSSDLKLKLQRAWETRRRPERRVELAWALCRALWWPLLQAVPPRLCNVALTMTQPFLISSVLSLVSEPDGDRATANKGYGLIGATALIYLGLAVSDLHYSQVMNRCITMSRGALVALIYDRALQVPDGLYDEATAVTLMSSDTTLIAQSLATLHDVWALTIQVAIGLFLLARQVGWVCVMPVVVVVVATYFASKVTKRVSANQKSWVDAVQKRVGVTSSVLSEMRSIKMMGLGSLMTDTLQTLRVRETSLMAGYRWNIVWKNVISNFAFFMAPPLTFAIYGIQAAVRGSDSFDTVQAFASLSIIGLLTGPVSSLLQSVPMTVAGLGSFDRVQKFLTATPRNDSRQVHGNAGADTNRDDSTTVSAQTNSEPESKAQDHETSGKSLRKLAVSVQGLDLRPVETADIVLRDISFDVPNSSVTMIIGPVASGKSTLIKAILGEGVVEKGLISVSDKRIAYCGQSPWLPNSTIRKAICGHISQANIDESWYQTCIRASGLDQDLSVLPEGDETSIGSGTTTLSGGQKHRVALARAVYTRAKIVVLDNVLSALDSSTKRTVVEALFSASGLFRKLGTTVLLVTHDTEYLSYADNILVLSQGNLTYNGDYNQAVLSGVIEKALPPASRASAEKGESESQPSTKKKLPFQTPKSTDRDDLKRKTGDMSLYKYYFSSVGWPKALMFLFFVILDVFGESFSQIWLKMWSDTNGKQVALYASVYLALPIATLVGVGGFVWSFLIVIAPSSSNKLHYILLKTVMRAPQAFFSATDTGSILNRFSQDMTLIESSLPIGAAVAVSNVIKGFASVGLIATGSVYLTATIPVIFFAIYCLQHVYLQTSRQLRFLDLEAKSPLYSHFLETLDGLATIRAFDWQQDNEIENHRLLDISQRPLYLLQSCQKWLQLVLALIVAAEAVLVVGLAVGLRHFTSAGLLGVSLTNILSFEGVLSMIVSFWTELETSLGSLARTRDFERTVKPEDKDIETQTPPTSWPALGQVEFREVTASHNPSATALHNLSLVIKPGQKVGLCGRTGSGKSSLVATLLRLLEIDSGAITIDGLDLATMPREIIRQRIVTLPQDPLILVGTVRLNADPRGLATDAAIIVALKDVGLWTALEERGGLDMEITASALSKGQQQLFALARALLQKSKIMLLDEPTSNIDPETDAMIQRLLKEKCAGCTVITVAHRMDTIMGSDMIVVLDAGKVMEVGTPAELLERDQMFAKLVKG